MKEHAQRVLIFSFVESIKCCRWCRQRDKCFARTITGCVTWPAFILPSQTLSTGPTPERRHVCRLSHALDIELMNEPYVNPLLPIFKSACNHHQLTSHALVCNFTQTAIELVVVIAPHDNTCSYYGELRHMQG